MWVTSPFNPKHHIYYETPGNQAGGGTGTATPPAPNPAQPATPPQPGAPGQGQQGQGDGFRQTYFPNVPDEHWSVMEPHLRNVQGYVTQLEQRYSPLRSYTPEAVQGLARFAQAFDQDPLGQWIVLARHLQQQGIIDPDLDLDDLAEIAPPGTPASQMQAPNGQQPQWDGLPEPAQQIIQQMQQTIQSLQQRLDQGDQTQLQRQQDAALRTQMGWMKKQLTDGGIPEDLITDQVLLSSFIANRGNAQQAVQQMIDYRNKTLAGYVQSANPEARRQNKDLDTSGGVPKTGKGNNGSRRGRGMFADVSAGAQQFLERQG